MSGRLCTESECTYTGQLAPKGCGCHADFEFAAAQTVYNRDGRKLYFRRDLGDGTAIVSRWLETETWDGESEAYVSDEPIIVSINGLFKAPPTEAISAEVAKLNGELAAAQEQLSRIERQTADAEAERARALAAVTAIEPLRNIERFIAGEITHFLVCTESYGGDFYGDVAIEPFEKTITLFSDRGRAEGMKLLSLFGNSKGDLTFRVNHYGEGSGGWRRVIPCLSEDEAREKAVELLELAWTAFDTANHSYRTAEAIKSADQLGIPVPDHIRAHQNAVIRTAREAAVTKARDDLAKAEAQLAQVQP